MTPTQLFAFVILPIIVAVGGWGFAFAVRWLARHPEIDI
jgi:hypothetical protein